MSILRPPDPTLPPDPLGSRADIHLTGATSALTLFILIALNTLVFPKGTMPADIAWAVSPVASYVVSTVTGRLARRRLLKAAHTAAQASQASEAPPGP